jgi:hypothetical protein
MFMRGFVIGAAALISGLFAGAAGAQTPASPYTFTCSEYISAQKSQDRGKANALLYWATGYLQGRLSPLPNTTFTAETFSKDIQDVHGALMRLCPNVPDMVIATFMNNLAGDFEKSAKPKQ